VPYRHRQNTWILLEIISTAPFRRWYSILVFVSDTSLCWRKDSLPHVRRLTRLRHSCTPQTVYFDAQVNQLTGTIPATVEKASNLTNLYLNNNFLSGSLPSALFALEALVHLQVGFNFFDGTLPEIPSGSLGFVSKF
jgi:hypothetical protein